jgi:hypothetical protein
VGHRELLVIQDIPVLKDPRDQVVLVAYKVLAVLAMYPDHRDQVVLQEQVFLDHKVFKVQVVLVAYKVLAVLAMYLVRKDLAD